MDGLVLKLEVLCFVLELLGSLIRSIDFMLPRTWHGAR